MKVAAVAICAVCLSACSPAEVPALGVKIYDTWQKERDLVVEPIEAVEAVEGSTLTVRVDSGDLIFVEENLVTIEEFHTFLAQRYDLKPESNVQISVHPDARNGTVSAVHDALIAAGFRDVDLVLTRD